MPYKEKWYPQKKKRADAEIGNTSAWPTIERAKKAGVSAVLDWRRDKTLESAARELRCYDSVNAIIDALQEKIRDRRGK